MTRLTLPIASYRLRSRQASPSRLVNCFPEALPADAKTALILTATPGIASFTTAGDGPIRAMHYSPALDLVFVVSAGTLYKINSAGTATSLGSVGAGGVNTIDMDDNGSNVVVVNTPLAYQSDGSSFGQISDADFTARGATDVEFCDNFMLFVDHDSGRFFGSDLGSVTAYDALNFATAEGAPDKLVGMKVDHRQVALFGSHSLELWENTGITGFPFERSVNGFIEIGCAAGRTIAKLDNTIFWLASDLTVRRLDGSTPVRISTHAVEQAVTTESLAGTLTEAKAYTYTQEGHAFYVLTLAGGTRVLDVTTGEWHERQSYGYDTWLAQSHCFAFGKHLVGSAVSNKIGYLDPSTHSEWSATRRMEWTYQPVYADGARAFHDRLEILFEAGVGLTSGQGSDPLVMLEYSDDFGQTWTSLPTRSIGAKGEYSARVVWNALGSSRARVYRVAVSDPVQITVADTQAVVRGGRL